MNAMDRFRRECTAFFEALEAGAQKPLVFGDGPSDGPVLMLVGEAPGEQEALEGRPFVGKAGRNLAGFLEACAGARFISPTSSRSGPRA